MLAVHFGAGSIGRGFIGDLLHQSGYDILFLDTDSELNAQLNRHHAYDLRVIEEGFRRKRIDRVRALSPVDSPEQAIAALVEASLVTTAVWADNLPRIAPLLSQGLQARRAAGKAKINVIACENAQESGQLLRAAVLAQNGLTAAQLDQVAAFPSTAVDRLVLANRAEGEAVIDVGVDYELIIEQSALVEATQQPIQGACYTLQLPSYLERKLFIINGGHAWAGYLGWIHGLTIIQDVFRQPIFSQQVRQAMRETAALLAEKYAFPLSELHDYVEFSCRRFALPGIEDSIARVCRSPLRKLAPQDRLVAPLMQCHARGLSYATLLDGVAAALLYAHPADEQAVTLQSMINQQGVADVVAQVCAIPATHPVHAEILARYSVLAQIKQQQHP